MSASNSFNSFTSWLRLKLVQLIWLAFGLAEAALGLRFALKLIDANPDNIFANLVYAVSDPLMAPFNNLAIAPKVSGMILELNALIAMAVGALVAWALIKLVGLIFSRPAAPPKPAQRQIVSRHITRAPPAWFEKPSR